MKFGVIYKIKNTLDGKVYIGQTVLDPPWERIKWHFKKSSDSVLCRAIKKHGKDVFEHEILITCFDEDYLNEMEEFYIKKFDCLAPKGYNLESGGKVFRNRSKQSKLKIKLKNKRNGHKVSKALKGVPKSEEHIKAMSETRKGFDSRNRKRARDILNKKRRASGDFVSLKATNVYTGQVKLYETISDCCSDLGLDPGCVSKASRGKEGRKQHKGYIFERITGKN